MDTTNLAILEELGLTPNEIEAYLGFLRYGKKTAAELARFVQMDKSSTYRAVESLEDLGLLMRHPQKRGTTYIASNPEHLKQLYKSKLAEVKSQGKVLSTFINELQKEHHTSKRSTFIRVERGIKAWETRMDEALSSKEKLIREQFRTDHRFFEDREHVRFVINHAKRRARNDVRLMQLEYFEDPKWGIFEDVMYQHKLYKKEVRIIPEEIDENTSFRIWDDTMNIVSFDDNDEFIVVTIKDKFISRLFKKMYDFIWRRSKPFSAKDFK